MGASVDRGWAQGLTPGEGPMVALLMQSQGRSPALLLESPDSHTDPPGHPLFCLPRPSQPGATPTCGRPARRSRTLMRTSETGSSSCSSWRSFQVSTDPPTSPQQPPCRCPQDTTQPPCRCPQDTTRPAHGCQARARPLPAAATLHRRRPVLGSSRDPKSPLSPFHGVRPQGSGYLSQSGAR